MNNFPDIPPFSFLVQKREFIAGWALNYIKSTDLGLCCFISEQDPVVLASRGNMLYEAFQYYLLNDQPDLVAFVREKTGSIDRVNDSSVNLSPSLNLFKSFLDKSKANKDIQNIIFTNELILLAECLSNKYSTNYIFPIKVDDAVKTGMQLFNQWNLEEAFDLFYRFQLKPHHFACQRLFSQVQNWLIMKWVGYIDHWEGLGLTDILEFELPSINYKSKNKSIYYRYHPRNRNIVGSSLVWK